MSIDHLHAFAFAGVDWIKRQQARLRRQARRERLRRADPETLCTIRLNTELASRPPECLEYVVVHELVHLLEPSHNARFVALMDQFMPAWRLHRDALSRSSVSS